MQFAGGGASVMSRELLWTHALPGADVEISRNRYAAPSSDQFSIYGGMLELSLTERAPRGQVYFNGVAGAVGGKVGMLAYFPAGRPFRGYWQQGTETTLRCFFAEPLAEGARPWSDGELAAALSINSPALMHIMRQIERESRRDTPFREEALQGLCLQLRAETKRYLWTQAFGQQEAGAGHDVIQRMKARIERGGMVTLRRLSREFGYSEGYLGRLFLAHTGRTFSSYAAAHRISKAMHLLGDGGLPIKEIAYRLGFSGPAEFSRCFKRSVGQSPARYRAAING